MLDTDICSYFMKRSHEGVTGRMRLLGADEVCISTIVHGELLFGVEVSPRREQSAAGVGQFLRYMQVLDLTGNIAHEYALIRADLKRRGQLIGSNDMWTAAHARHLGLPLLTNNTREFSRVSGLSIENWAEAS